MQGKNFSEPAGVFPPVLFFVSAADYGCFCADFVIKEKLPVCKGERESLILERG